MKLLPGLILLIPLAFLAGYYWDGSPNYGSEQVDLISCAHFSEAQLEYMGYQGEGKQKSCEELNLALHRQALDECGERIGSISSIGENHYKQIMDACVYHELAASIGTINSAELIRYQGAQ